MALLIPKRLYNENSLTRARSVALCQPGTCCVAFRLSIRQLHGVGPKGAHLSVSSSVVVRLFVG